MTNNCDPKDKSEVSNEYLVFSEIELLKAMP